MECNCASSPSKGCASLHRHAHGCEQSWGTFAHLTSVVQRTVMRLQALASLQTRWQTVTSAALTCRCHRGLSLPAGRRQFFSRWLPPAPPMLQHDGHTASGRQAGLNSEAHSLSHEAAKDATRESPEESKEQRVSEAKAFGCIAARSSRQDGHGRAAASRGDSCSADASTCSCRGRLAAGGGVTGRAAGDGVGGAFIGTGGGSKAGRAAAGEYCLGARALVGVCRAVSAAAAICTYRHLHAQMRRRRHT